MTQARQIRPIANEQLDIIYNKVIKHQQEIESGLPATLMTHIVSLLLVTCEEASNPDVNDVGYKEDITTIFTSVMNALKAEASDEQKIKNAIRMSYYTAVKMSYGDTYFKHKSAKKITNEIINIVNTDSLFSTKLYHFFLHYTVGIGMLNGGLALLVLGAIVALLIASAATPLIVLPVAIASGLAGSAMLGVGLFGLCHGKALVADKMNNEDRLIAIACL